MSDFSIEVKSLTKKFGGFTAVDGVSFEVGRGSIFGFLGANGAGKSTTLNTISGLIPAQSGAIRFRDRNITRMPAETIVRQGVVQVPEGRKIFAILTVRENLEMGSYTRSSRGEIGANLERVFRSFPRLKERLGQLGGTLSGGEQQMLAIARGMMAQPTLLLLDEPSMGLSPLLVEEIFGIIQEINATGTNILLVEQNAQMALSLADRGYVLETGTVVMEGSGQDLLHNPEVAAAYLGA